MYEVENFIPAKIQVLHMFATLLVPIGMTILQFLYATKKSE